MIRPFQDSDIPVIADIEYDPITKKYVDIPSRIKEEWLHDARRTLDFRGWVIVALPENEVAGRVCLSETEDKSAGVVELEIIISKRFWGKALGRKVASLMIQAAFNELKAKTVRADVHPDNAASLALLNAFGFRYKCPAKKQPMLLYDLDRGTALLRT